ncbi:MAG: hypothetical protein H6699_08260 [Myxococcales bacterium]|nr:hypothetical protein [Myxococcales bacterium]
MGAVDADALVTAFYADDSVLTRYRVAGVPIAFAVRPGWIGHAIPIPLPSAATDTAPMAQPAVAGQSILRLVDEPPPPPRRPVAEREAEGEAIIRAGGRLWDNPLFRLARVTEAPPFELAVGTYFGHRLDVGAVGGEADRAARGVDEAAAFPLRSLLLRDLAAMRDVSTRTSAIGINTLLALRRPAPDDDYALVLTRRSHAVESGGRLCTAPTGYHQPLHDPAVDIDPVRTAARELAEELFGADEDASDWRDVEPARRILERGAYYFTAAGFYLTSGGFDLSLLLVVDDPDVWPDIAPKLAAGWESDDDVLIASSRDASRWLREPGWHPSGLVGLAEGLRALATTGRIESLPDEVPRLAADHSRR